MNQSKLEQRVKQLFEEQGFKVSQEGNRMTAENSKKMSIEVFSSKAYDIEEIDPVDEESLVFVDKELSEIKQRIGNEVSVIESADDEPDYDLPSYELIGSIAVINELVDMDKEDAVEGILAHHPRVETVLLKKGGLKGEFRVGDYERLYGETTETIHKEFGCRFRVDPTKVYFSERYGTERNRVISQIKEGEKVLVMFAGVGPFAVMAARNRDPDKVVAVEKNPEAAKYLRENIDLNNVEDVVEVFEGDVSHIIPDLEDFDRIMMPLPGMADDYLDLAVDRIEEDGIIHYYRFLEDEKWGEIIDEVDEVFGADKRDYSLLEKTVCGNRSPGVDRICLDIRVD